MLSLVLIRLLNIENLIYGHHSDLIYLILKSGGRMVSFFELSVFTSNNPFKLVYKLFC